MEAVEVEGSSETSSPDEAIVNNSSSSPVNKTKQSLAFTIQILDSSGDKPNNGHPRCSSRNPPRRRNLNFSNNKIELKDANANATESVSRLLGKLPGSRSEGYYSADDESKHHHNTKYNHLIEMERAAENFKYPMEENDESIDDCKVDISEKLDSLATTSSVDPETSSISAELEANGDNMEVFNVSSADARSDDEVSETGTYTVHKDYTDEEKARMDIDKVFGIGLFSEEDCNQRGYMNNFKMSLSRDNNAWISEWANQVAEHHAFSAMSKAIGRTPPLSPTKIPSPIRSLARRFPKGRQEQSDSSLEVEYMVHASTDATGDRCLPFDSGGESDDDTSNSYNAATPHSQRSPGRLSDALLKRINANEARRSFRRCRQDPLVAATTSSTSQLLAKLNLGKRSSSLDRKDFRELKSPTSPNLGRLTSPIMGKANNNSPIMGRKQEISAKILTSSPVLAKSKRLSKPPPQAKNIGYFTCVENSPYMLRKSNSASYYHCEGGRNEDNEFTALQCPPNKQRNVVQRSASAAAVRSNSATRDFLRKSALTRGETIVTEAKGTVHLESTTTTSTSDSNSDAESHQRLKQRETNANPISSSGIKLNRAFSIRRARLNCADSDTATPQTTPEERRKKSQEQKTSITGRPKAAAIWQPSTAVKEQSSSKSSGGEKPRVQSTISRTDSGRFSTRAAKPASNQRNTAKSPKDQKRQAGRSNSTLTSKEVEFQNWKRRKSYDPMKAAAEGKRKLESTRKNYSAEQDCSQTDHDNSSVLRSASFHGTGAALSLARDWDDAELHHHVLVPPPPSSPRLRGSDSDLETSCYLQATQSVMSAMSARITAYRSPCLVDSGGESDEEDTSQSLHHQRSEKVSHRDTDSESSDDHLMPKIPKQIDVRRGRPMPASPVNVIKLSGNSSRTSNRQLHVRGKSEPSKATLSRTDSGRISLRSAKSPATSSKTKEATRKPTGPSAKEVEMQNWKRRKSYDPMKAAMEGKKKATLAKRAHNPTLSPNNVARSQSFHGSAGLVASDWSDEELTLSADESPFY